VSYAALDLTICLAGVVLHLRSSLADIGVRPARSTLALNGQQLTSFNYLVRGLQATGPRTTRQNADTRWLQVLDVVRRGNS